MTMGEIVTQSRVEVQYSQSSLALLDCTVFSCQPPLCSHPFDSDSERHKKLLHILMLHRIQDIYMEIPSQGIRLGISVR